MAINEVKADGYFYTKDGLFLGKEGNSEKVYVATKYKQEKDPTTSKIKITYEEIQDLEISHSDLCYIGGIIKHESGSNELKELKCIAFASYNESVNLNTTWKSLLVSSYSSVPNKDSQKLTDNKESKNDDEIKSNKTRSAIISVLLKETDITNGATFWDGTDFLAWGTNENKFDSSTKIGHNKFREYKFIEIPKNVYNSFLNANKNASRTYTMKVKHDTTKCRGKHEHITVKGIEKIKYPMPAEVFENKKYWSEFYFYYDTNIKDNTYGLSATIAAGKSIFWKKVKQRLGKVENRTAEIHGFIDEIGFSKLDSPKTKSWILDDL